MSQLTNPETLGGILWYYLSGGANAEEIEEIKQEVYQALLGIIGEDDNGEVGDTYAFAARERNGLRATQRQAVKAFCGVSSAAPEHNTGT